MALKIAKVNHQQANIPHELRGNRAFEMGDLDTAVTHFLSALELDDQNAGLYLKIGTVFLQQGKVDKAIIALKRSLELAPYQADTYNAMGHALFQLGFFAAAEAFFARALELDFKHATAKGNLIEARKRQRDGEAPMPPEFETVMALLAVKDPTISLCMIAKNEEQFLGDCLASVRGLVDEIILVDTGSTDRTIEIAESFGAKVFHAPWTGDFAAARNVSLSQASGDWILVLDADEIIESEWHEDVKQAIRHPENVGYHLVIENLLGDRGESSSTALIFRLFRNRLDINFEGIIHEQASPSALRLGRPLGYSLAKITHRGYLNVYMEQRNKAERNLQLVLKQVSDEPENAYAQFNLGQTYSLLGKDYSQQAEEAFLRSLTLLQQQDAPLSLVYYTTLYVNFVELYRSMGQVDKGLELVDRALASFPRVPDLLYLKGQLLLDSERFQEAIQVFQSCKAFKGQLVAGGGDPSIPTYKASKALAQVYLNLGNGMQAKHHLLEASEEVGRPDFEILTLLGMASMQLGDHVAALNDFIKATELEGENAMAWFNMGLVAYRRREFGLAYQAWQKSHDLEPTPDRALCLGMVLIRLKRPTDAESLFVSELESNPVFAAAQLQMGMARLAAGNPEGARMAWNDLLKRTELEAGLRAEAEALRDFCHMLTGEGVPTLANAEGRPEALLAAWEAAVDLLFLNERYAEIGRALEVMKSLRIPGLHLRVGYQLFGFGLLEESVAFLLSAREEAPQDATVYEVLGDVARELGNSEDAEVMYQSALSLKPRQVDLRIKLQNLRESRQGNREGG